MTIKISLQTFFNELEKSRGAREMVHVENKNQFYSIKSKVAEDLRPCFTTKASFWADSKFEKVSVLNVELYPSCH